MSPQIPGAADSGGARSILDAATQLFADEGYEPVSVARIAAHAGVCKANVFHHYASKEALFLAVMQQVSLRQAEHAEALLQQPGRSADKLRELFAFELATMLADSARSRLIMRECRDGGHPRARELARQVFTRNFKAVTALVEQGRERGEFRAELQPEAVTLMLISGLHFFLQQREGFEQMPGALGLGDAGAYAEQFCSVLLGGVLQPAAAAVPAKAKPAPQPRRARTGRSAA